MLISDIGERIPAVITKIRESLGKVKEGLERIDNDLIGVYEDADKFAPGSSSESSDTETYQSAFDALQGALKSKSHHESLPGRTRYIVNTVKILHSHLIALVHSHDESITSVPASIKAKILSFTSADLSLVAPFSDQVKSYPASEVSAKLTALKDNSALTTLCIIYGKVDGAQILENPPIDEVCKEANAYGMGILKEKIQKGSTELTMPKSPENESDIKDTETPTVQ
jgi:hypothetical protein